MKLLVLGAGGIGGYFGGRLAEAGVDVTFLVRPARREQIVRDGLRISSPLGDLTLAAKTVVAGELTPGYDFVLLTCKAYDLDSAIEAIAPAMDGTCAIVPMLNGIAHFDRLAQRFGEGNVLGGACRISVSLRKDGVIEHPDPLQQIVFGERSCEKTARAGLLAEAFGRTKLDWELADDINQVVWEKIVFLSVLAGTTCLFRGNIGHVVAATGGRDAVERMLNANLLIAAREGHPARASAAEIARKVLTEAGSKRSSSMLFDVERGGPVESDHVIGWMLERARMHGVDDTMLSLAYTHLKAYEARRAETASR